MDTQQYWRFDFGDGTKTDYTTKTTAEHKYTRRGTYAVITTLAVFAEGTDPGNSGGSS